MNKTQLSSLTPLRGIAAIWVVIFHYDEFLNFMGLGFLIDRDVSMLIGKGYLLVDFFFLLSGFVICHAYGESLSTGNKGSTRNYLWARFTRLYPLHAFAMFALLFQFIWLKYAHAEYAKGWDSWYPTYDFFVYLLFGQSSGILKEFSWNLPSWSIAAEWWTYVLAVLFLPYINRGFTKRTILTWVFATCGLLLLSSQKDTFDLDFTINAGTLRCLFSFIIGVGLYQAYLKLVNTETFFANDSTFIFASVCAVLAISFSPLDLLIIPIFCIIIISAVLNKNRVNTALNIKPLKILGDISYSIYLMQIFWLSAWSIWFDLYYKPAHLDVIPSPPLKLIWLALCILVLIASSYLTYRYVEIPAQKLLRKRFK